MGYDNASCNYHAIPYKNRQSLLNKQVKELFFKNVTTFTKSPIFAPVLGSLSHKIGFNREYGAIP
jgi:hypothetical protein